ncbi:MlaE family ABC transporter permease [Candidatus Magnetaquicoccus inordinatus]|uniref:MlaE family ABC transporter permease n=1 Tax=Candidatus Magnetaquicoccus inordinatus TaxID=2496818 RepID=UPI00187D3922|nr:ABC transporter permease [Candidatus Magnetaquicoccus inordinatus]
MSVEPTTPSAPPRPHLPGYLSAPMQRTAGGMGRFSYMSGNLVSGFFHTSAGRYQYLLKHSIQQIYFTTLQSWQLVFFIGLALGILMVVPMVSLGFTDIDMLSSLISKVLFQQLIPFLTAIVAIGRSGTAITSEIASMQSQQAIDMLLLQGIDPHHLLVQPRVIGMILSMLLLTTWMIAGAILGASSIVLMVDDAGWLQVMRACASMLTLKEWGLTALMMLWFGMAIGTIHCYYGFQSANAVQTAMNLPKAFVRSFLSCLLVITLFSLVRYG